MSQLCWSLVPASQTREWAAPLRKAALTLSNSRMSAAPVVIGNDGQQINRRGYFDKGYLILVLLILDLLTFYLNS